MPAKPRSLPPWLPLVLAALAIAAIFIALNHGAWDGFFQDDELDNVSWAPAVPARQFVTALASPLFDVDNFRPVGHLYFALMGARFGLNFAPWITPLFAIHLLNGFLLFLLMRKLAIRPWTALAGAAFFVLSAAAFDAYWKPMYVFDLLCTTFSLLSLLLYASRRWVLSFLAFWLAYKAKELAVMLPLVLAAWEYWFGERRFRVLALFLAASLSFGVQGIVRNPNHNNEYTFHFELHALRATVPFYAGRFLMIRLSGLALFALALIRDRRIWFGLAMTSILLSTLLFLPGRLYEAYAYLPLTGAAIALSAAASRVSPVCAWIALAIWMPFNVRQVRHESRALLAQDDKIFAFVSPIGGWSRVHPEIRTLVYNAAPPGFHSWGVTAAWNLAHGSLGTPAPWAGSPEAKKIVGAETVAWGNWNGRQLDLQLLPAGESAESLPRPRMR